MRKVLMIAYHFYPDLRVGALRSIKFAKYLPELGWTPIIVTVDSDYYQRKDPAPLGYECDINRTSKLPTIDDLYGKIKIILSRMHHNSKANMPVPIKKPDDAMTHRMVAFPLWKRFFNSLSHTPDSDIGWFLPAIRKAISQIRKNNIDIVFSSGPPWTCHLVALVAKKMTGKKWIADFRDPWTLWERSPELKTALSVKFGKYLEKKVVSNADVVLTTTPELRDAMKKLHYPILEQKCFLIYNGYDAEDFVTREPRPAIMKGKIRFLYAGTLYMGQDPSNFFMAIRQLLNEKVLREDGIVIDIVGNCEMEEFRRAAIVSENRLHDFVKFKEPVPRADYLHEIINSDILLLIQPDTAPMQIPAKTFEYLATGNEIIALIGKGATHNLLSDYDRVSIADPDNVGQIKGAIRRSLSRLFNRVELGTIDYDNSLTKKQLTADLARQLDKIVSSE